ncbi:MAG TPA: sulfur carrier protein ThiS [Actinomycetes bacterium]|jgi:sulfur carrier protein|nr:sulfur carrier protein ThiS [Actinomycetes bacterium]
MTVMTVLVNGEPAQVEQGTTVSALLLGLGHDASGAGIAVAVNGEVVPRGAWPTSALGEHDRIEVLGAAQGG